MLKKESDLDKRHENILKMIEAGGSKAFENVEFIERLKAYFPANEDGYSPLRKAQYGALYGLEGIMGKILFEPFTKSTAQLVEEIARHVTYQDNSDWHHAVSHFFPRLLENEHFYPAAVILVDRAVCLAIAQGVDNGCFDRIASAVAEHNFSAIVKDGLETPFIFKPASLDNKDLITSLSPRTRDQFWAHFLRSDSPDTFTKFLSRSLTSSRTQDYGNAITASLVAFQRKRGLDITADTILHYANETVRDISRRLDGVL